MLSMMKRQVCIPSSNNKEHWYNYSMKEVIYDTLEDAKQACKAYVDAMRDLQELLGIYETSDDSCAQTYVHAKWRNADGVIVEYTYW